MRVGNPVSEFGVLPQVPEPSQESASHPKLLALGNIVAVPSDTLISGEGLVVRASIKRDRSGQPCKANQCSQHSATSRQSRQNLA